jgi:hypothetical protein
MEDAELAAFVGVLYGFMTLVGALHVLRRKKCKRVWVKPWILERPIKGAYSSLFSDLLNTDEISFRNFVRMDFVAFEELLSRVEFGISKHRTRPNYRDKL